GAWEATLPEKERLFPPHACKGRGRKMAELVKGVSLTMMNSNELMTTYAHLMTLLATEESAGATTDVAMLHTRNLRRHSLTELLSSLEESVRQVRSRVSHLPHLPRLAQVRQAQALLAFPNLAFLEVDTDGLDADADILRI